MKRNKGITLIALVITIIVLLILAAVSIATLTGENGILTQANKAKNKTEQAHEKEQIQLAYMAVKSKKMETGDNTKISAEDLKKEFENDEIEAQATDGEEGKIKVTFSKTGNEYTIDENGKVEFEEKIPLIKATSIKAEDLTIEAGVKTKQLNVTTTPSEITEELIYTSKNEEIVTVDNEGKVTARGEGTAEVEIKGEKSGTKSICNVTVEFGVGVKALTQNQTYANNGTAIIPVGFCIVPGCDNIGEGLVISDNDEDTEVNKDSIVAEGNQFVWVPVPVAVEDITTKQDKEINFETESTPMATIKTGENYRGVLYDETSYNMEQKTVKIRPYNDQSGYREPSLVENFDNNSEYYSKAGITNDLNDDEIVDGKDFEYELQTTFNNMIKSVTNHKGFYISRYEMSLSTEKNAQSKKNQVSANTTPSSADTWYGLYKKSKEFAKKESNIASSMIWGSQYDAMMNWMAKNNIDVKSNDTDSIKNDTRITGSKESDKVLNVYDLFGNSRELTLETSRSFRSNGKKWRFNYCS